MNQDQADYFHRMVACLLFVAKRTQPYLQVEIAYLCTRVKAPNECDYDKLRRVIKYIRRTIHLPLLLGWDESGTITWSVDASFAVHGDYQSHTGATASLGKGSVLALSMKQKINTKSSTETELVGVDDAANYLVWLKLFFEWQTNYYKDTIPTKKVGQVNVLLQDNTSAIQLERHGKSSSTKRTRHLAIKYFYANSLLQNRTITTVEYCPTEEMISDFLSKPLQGSLFRKHRNTLLGITEKEEAKHSRLYYEERNPKQ